MVIGHFGVGLAAKRYAPSLSLGLLFVAAQFADLLWPDLLLLKIERVSVRRGDDVFPLDFLYYPFSHSLLMSVAWASLFAVIYWAVKRDVRNSIVLALCALSHWILDLVVHKPDLPLFPNDTHLYGFGIWRSPLATALIEGALFVVGIVFYLKTTTPRKPAGVWGFWLLIVLLAAGHIAGRLSPPPTNTEAIGWGTQVIWLFVLLGFWVDKNRAPYGNII